MLTNYLKIAIMLPLFMQVIVACSSAETYVIELQAPLIDNNEFPVAIDYYNDLLDNKNKLKAYLLVPVKLTITGSQKRRLFTIYTMNSNSKLKFGTDLLKINQVHLTKKQIKVANLQTFIGPDKNIYHTKKSDTTNIIKFKIPITHKHFNGGSVKILVGSSNGTELSNICELNSKCMKDASFTIKPRYIKYGFKLNGGSNYIHYAPTHTNKVYKSNVDLHIFKNNIKRNTLLREDLPASFSVGYNKNNQKYTIDIRPIIPYMSSDAYHSNDKIISTYSVSKPILDYKNIKKAEKLLDN